MIEKQKLTDVQMLSKEERAVHEFWMRHALALANQAEALGEVPIGAIIVLNNEIIGQGYNLRETQKSALAHAEILAIEDANKYQDAWRLEGASLYVTLEPCPMCAGALINARIDTIVYGASDIKAGCAGTLMNLPNDTRFNHQAHVIRGVLAEECGQKLSAFFKNLRRQRKEAKIMNNPVDK